jgi:hypothetical protein
MTQSKFQQGWQGCLCLGGAIGHLPWSPDGTLGFAAPPRPVPGGYVRLRAEMDLVIAFSACPQDILPIMAKQQSPSRRILKSSEEHLRLERKT